MSIHSSEVSFQTGIWDRIGVGVSGLCAAHCAVTPIVVAVLPLWSALEEVNHWIHPVLAVLLIPVTLLALYTCLRTHRHPAVLALLGSGLTLILAAWLFGHDLQSHHLEAVLTSLGGALLIAGHVVNARQAHASRQHTCHPSHL